MSFSEDPTRGVGAGATSGEDPMGSRRAGVTPDPMGPRRADVTPDPMGPRRADVTPDPMGPRRTDVTPDPMGTQRTDVALDPTQGAEAGEQPSQDPTQGSEPNASRPEPTHEEISVRAYFLYLEAPESDELGNWLRAERELTPA